MHVPPWKPQPWIAPVTLVCLVLGALIALLLSISTQSVQNIDPSTMRHEQLAAYYTQLKQQNSELQKQFEALQKERDNLLYSQGTEKQIVDALHQEMTDLRARTGAVPLEGQGIVITIDDSKMMASNPGNIDENALLTHDVDLMLLVNELRAAGAEAIALNDQRVVGSTAIRCVGPVINVNNRPISGPFVVKAIGKVDTLYGAVNLPLGVLDQLKQLGIRVEVAKREKVRAPRLAVLMPISIGKVPPEKHGK